ncbi:MULTISPECIES: site-specific integrase [Weeksellaceae]|uniref:Site-specific integrase n=1 Tax=Chryseobacterium shandongense TaxID=1493872 RepID=A0AAD0YAX0_9FLAO|nr:MULTISPECIES: site-specific integrase [Weeksellaceae]MCT4319291.1 site-specific integrase [Elizabethkingia anophelis]ATN07287.1 recombinase [Chryseobacterium indologenes]AYY83965.1 site-specific integrase [Chryseobacterium indologenes]AZA87671.1 site-specific integrase [Chryseobacterium shandongense]AZA96170.1 site-specific integrase [Chryseobacterium shandongense]
MNKTFNLLFYVKKSKTNSEGQSPIYMRITIDGKICEISTKRHILPTRWNSQSQKVAGSSEESRSINFYLKSLEQKVYDTYHQMIRDKETPTCEALKNKLIGKDDCKRTLIPIFNDHNNRMKKLIGQEFAQGTLERYNITLQHTQQFLKWKYNTTDIDILKIDLAFLNDFEFYLRTEKSCSNNTAVKYVKKNFGKIIRNCIANGWITKDPFLNYKSSFDEVTRTFLTEEEIEKLFNKDFKNERLSQVRYIFLFSCFTGLAYIDTQNLTHKNIRVGLDGNKWIFTNRQKTKTASNIPLLPQAEEIIKKYRNHPTCLNNGKLLPILSNQKMNCYLKEIADLCEIDKELTYHIARHTFATTITLSNGVPIESVSKMLGHKNIKTTQHYAKILDQKVSEDMSNLKMVFKNKGKMEI